MQLGNLLGFPLAAVEQQLKQDGRNYRVEVSKAPRAVAPLHSNQLRVVRARTLADMVILTVVEPPVLELPV